jgi:D-arabinose 1-dehydrogenase-like Zn-dependent alcohol dehydrogenase
VPHAALARIPVELNFSDAAPLMCAGMTTFNALRHSGANPGDTVAIVGLGNLGHLAVQFASKMGFRTVVVAREKDKEQLAKALGADTYIQTSTCDPVKVLKELGGCLGDPGNCTVE